MAHYSCCRLRTLHTAKDKGARTGSACTRTHKSARRVRAGYEAPPPTDDKPVTDVWNILRGLRGTASN